MPSWLAKQVGGLKKRVTALDASKSKRRGGQGAMMFELTDGESKKADEWVAGHNERHHQGKHPYGGAIGGTISFTFTPTSLGIITSVQCFCKKEDHHVLTNFDDW